MTNAINFPKKIKKLFGSFLEPRKKNFIMKYAATANINVATNATIKSIPVALPKPACNNIINISIN